MTLEALTKALEENAYISDRSVALSILLSIQLEKPLLIEGPAGVGKTEIAKVLATILSTSLIRLQCYEGIDVNQAVYEWHYQKQLLHLKMLVREGINRQTLDATIFSEDFLMDRPILKAIRQESSPVLLIDEVDRSDEEFESFLLELLSDWQLTIPEIGTIPARSKPYVILTGNRTRELSEALRRRCLYLWIDYPSFEKELAIVTSKIPDIDERLAVQICGFMKELRQMQLEKTPGVAETLDWARALATLHFDYLDNALIEDTLGVVLKDWQDIRRVSSSLSELLEQTKVTSKIS